jgi:hypothetical protein
MRVEVPRGGSGWGVWREVQSTGERAGNCGAAARAVLPGKRSGKKTQASAVQARRANRVRMSGRNIRKSPGYWRDTRWRRGMVSGGMTKEE